MRHVLGSSDRVMVIRGAAGTGKTSMMQEAVEAIQRGPDARRVFVFAPSTAASRGVLREKHFNDADTVARLLVDETMHDSMHGQVIWIDEAGHLARRPGPRRAAGPRRPVRNVLNASSREQFYVSASRGTEQVTVYTDHKLELLDAITRSDERLSATELVGTPTPTPTSPTPNPPMPSPSILASPVANRIALTTRARASDHANRMHRMRRVLAASPSTHHHEPDALPSRERDREVERDR